MQDSEGSYIVGGHLGGNQVQPAAGTIIHYQHKRKKPARDIIKIIEPTHEILRVVVSKSNISSGQKFTAFISLATFAVNIYETLILCRCFCFAAVHI